MKISRKFAWLAMLVLFSLVMTGCAGVSVRSEQPAHSRAVVLDDDNTVGQTFTAHYDGLESVHAYLSPLETSDGQIILHLRTSPGETDDLRTTSIPIIQVNQPGYYAFEFSPVEDSNRKDFYAIFEVDGTGGVEAGTASGEAYLFGALYQNGRPQDAQLTFSLGHARAQMYIGLLKEGFTWLVWWLACMLLFLVPGWALMEAIWPGWRKLNWAEKLGVSAGVGLAMYPLMLLWTQAVGLQLGWLYAWLPASISLAWLAWRHRTEIISLGRVKADLYINLRRMVLDGSLLLIVVIGLIIYSRFWTIRRVDLPMWGDSYQHAMMSQLILDNHGLFSTWQPYSPYYSLSVHFGFPAQSAVFGWMLGKDGATAALVFGQVVNILAVLTLLPLALRLSRGSLWAGAAALIAAGLIFQVPAYYVNWGRYAQLGGQAIFPVAAWLTWDALSRFNDRAGIPGRRVMAWMSILLLTGSVIAGALLTYYRMAYFYFTFMVIWGLAFALPSFRLHWGRWGTAVTVAAGIAVSSLLWLLPWYPHTQKSHLSEVVEVGMAIRRPIDFVLADLKAWNAAWEYYPQALTVILLLALVWGLIRRQWMIPGLIAWIAFLAAYTFGQLLQLPAANLLTNFSILIAVYIPASLIIGWLIGDFAGWMHKKSILGAVLLGLALFVMALYGANQVRNVANMDTFSLVNRPDQRAASWIGENIPAEARILVEGFTIYGGSTAVGADGGWWLPLLVKRENTMPPQYALMNEVPRPATYSREVVALVRELEVTAPGSRSGLSLLCENRITHVYIGQTQGMTGSPARQLFKPEDFLNHPEFELIYQQDRVFIFALRAEACPNP